MVLTPFPLFSANVSEIGAGQSAYPYEIRIGSECIPYKKKSHVQGIFEKINILIKKENLKTIKMDINMTIFEIVDNDNAILEDIDIDIS